MTDVRTAPTVLLGTVAIEPNRWSGVDPSGRPVADLAAWADRIGVAGFDGLELWERHLPSDTAEATGLLAVLPPVRIFNSYLGFDDDRSSAWRTVADRVALTGARGVKFNVGNDPASFDDYVARVSRWATLLPPGVQLLCECHEGISIAEDPETAARLFDAVGPPERIGAIVHTHETPTHLRARFEAYGDRISHVHVNHLDTATFTVPRLADRRDQLEERVELLRSLGFRGTWTLEFVEGVLTDHDETGALLDQAEADLVVLRTALGY